MKRIVLLIFAALIFVMPALPIMAEFENPPIVDLAGYLTESEFSKLSEKLDAVRKKYNFEVAVYTETTMSGIDAQSSADDIYDNMGYGGGENDDGILFYICSGTREYHFTTHGYGLEAFTDNGLIYLEDKIWIHLTEDNYYEAINAYIQHTDELLAMAANGTPYNKLDPTYVVIVIGGALIIPLMIAFIMMGIKAAAMKTVVSQDHAANYISDGGLKLNVSRDIFLYSRVTKTPRPKSKSTGSTHISSSGRSHGGRGGRF